MYKVIKEFTDLQTGHVYKKGDTFPKDGVKVSDARIAKLASNKNRQGTPLISKDAKDALNPATPSAQLPHAVQEETPLDKEVAGVNNGFEKAKRGRKKKDD